ncbi:hypothetical protein NliqN6_5801 [Naganishia liquefaciens]|uniref:Uncharacterized protein n=1 Tax=Naganishia liquefaciens TaxID=104408 RepID=A0A8H3TYE1_9TREE|nr:hypothetical protein NliqN6_5801 [Naganishia liquefaciens]
MSAVVSLDLSFIRQLKAPRSGYITVAYKHALDKVPRGQAECQWYPPKDGTRPKAIVVFFPGNPGLVEYYPPFLSKLQSLIPRSYGVLSMGHVGHSLSLSFQTQALTLNEQVLVKVDLVTKLRQEVDAWAQESGYEGAPIQIGVMGHSVGAEIAVQTMRAVESESPSSAITASFLLFPTLAHIARTPNALRLAPLFRSPLLELVPVLLMLFKPIFLLINLVYYLFPSTRNAQSSSIYAPNPITVTMLETPIVVSHVLRLARSEMQTIRDPDLDWYRKNGQDGNGRVFSYWGANDGWVGREGDAVKVALRGEQEQASAGEEVTRLIECKDNIPHAFCLAHSDFIASKVADWVTHAFKQKRL